MPECPVCQINTDLLTSTQKKQHKRDCEYKTMAVTLADGNILIVKRDSGTGQFVCVYCGNRRKDSNKMRVSARTIAVPLFAHILSQDAHDKRMQAQT